MTEIDGIIQEFDQLSFFLDLGDDQGNAGALEGTDDAVERARILVFAELLQQISASSRCISALAWRSDESLSVTPLSCCRRKRVRWLNIAAKAMSVAVTIGNDGLPLVK